MSNKSEIYFTRVPNENNSCGVDVAHFTVNRKKTQECTEYSPLSLMPT